MELGYVYIIVDPLLKDKIILGYSQFLPRKVIADYKASSASDDASIEWLLSFPNSVLALDMIQYKLAPLKSHLVEDCYNISIDTALSMFLKSLVDFFEMFKNRDRIHWRINQYVTYDELCVKTNLELMYPLLHRSYIRNKLTIYRRDKGLESD